MYIKTLTDDLDEWIAKGWVPAESRDKILGAVAAKQPPFSLVGLLAILGAVLLALAAITFVAANWAAMPKLARMGIMLAVMWTAYGVAAWSLVKQVHVYAHAFALLGAALFGACIMLIAQTFNIAANHPTGVLIWGIGAVLTALIIPSRPVLVFSTLLLALWMFISFTAPIPDKVQYWLWPVLVLALGYTAQGMTSRVSLHVLAISLLFFVPLLLDGLGVDERTGAPLAGGIFAVLALASAWIADGKTFGMRIFVNWMAISALGAGFITQLILDDGWRNNAGAVEISALLPVAIILTLLAVLLFSRLRKQVIKPTESIVLLAGVTLMMLSPWLRSWIGILPLQFLYGAAFFGICVALMALGFVRDRNGLVWAGGTGFVAQSLYVYFETFKDLLNTSLFFFVGGVLLLAFSFAAFRLNKRLLHGEVGS